MGSFGDIAFAADPVCHEDNSWAFGLFTFSTVADGRASIHAMAGMERALEDIAVLAA